MTCFKSSLISKQFMLFSFQNSPKMFPSTFLRLGRRFNLNSALCSSLVRHKSTNTKDLVLIDVNDKTGFATLTMNSLPVNSLNLELLTAFSKSLDVIIKENVKGMILTSVRYFKKCLKFS